MNQRSIYEGDFFFNEAAYGKIKDLTLSKHPKKRTKSYELSFFNAK